MSRFYKNVAFLESCALVQKNPLLTITRAALSTSGRTKSDFLSVYPPKKEPFRSCPIWAKRLTEVAAGFYNLAALPLKIAGADGAPLRAILWRE